MLAVGYSGLAQLSATHQKEYEDMLSHMTQAERPQDESGKVEREGRLPRAAGLSECESDDVLNAAVNIVVECKRGPVP